MKTIALVLGIAFGLISWMPQADALKESPSASATEIETRDGGTNWAVREQFINALNAWLDNDDAVAIPILSRLATEGHVPAQIFLARIANRVASEFVEGLSREDRNRVLRAPGGLSGKSWISVAAKAGNPLAQAFEASTLPPYGIDELRGLLDHAETAEATGFLLRSTASGRMDGIEDLLEDDRLPKAAAYTIWLSIIQNETLKSEQKKKVDQFLLNGGIGAVIVATELISRYGGQLPGHLENLSQRLSANTSTLLEPMTEKVIDLRNEPTPALGSLTAYCNTFCQDEVPRCLYDALVLVGGYDELWKLMSPVESYLSTPTYIRSKRVISDVERTMRSKYLRHDHRYRELLARNSCAADPILRD